MGYKLEILYGLFFVFCFSMMIIFSVLASKENDPDKKKEHQNVGFVFLAILGVFYGLPVLFIIGKHGGF